MAQKQTQKQKAKTESARPETKPEDKKAKPVEDMDALMDEIDGVLESNAEEFVKAYVQKGGE